MSLLKQGMLTFFIAIPIHNKTETRGMSKLPVSTKLYSAVNLVNILMHQKQFWKLYRRKVKTRKDSYNEDIKTHYK